MHAGIEDPSVHVVKLFTVLANFDVASHDTSRLTSRLTSRFRITWTRDGVPLSLNATGSGVTWDAARAQLVIAEVSERDVGRYACAATNEHGVAKSNSMQLTLAGQYKEVKLRAMRRVTCQINDVSQTETKRSAELQYNRLSKTEQHKRFSH